MSSNTTNQSNSQPANQSKNSQKVVQKVKQQNNNGNKSKRQARICPGRDIYERMNFLYQASMMMSCLVPPLSANYGKLMKSIGKKATLRIEPAIKRTLCTRCGVALNPGTTASYNGSEEFPEEKLNFVQVKCNLCGYSKRYCNLKGHTMFLDDPRSVVETLTFE